MSKIDALLAEGWVYRDTPRMLPESWDELLGIIGSENFILLTEASYEGEQPATKRGQLLISPQGVANMTAYSERRAALKEHADAG